jgi:hypothetical protein
LIDGMATLHRRAELLPFSQGDIPGYSLERHTQAHWSLRLWGHLGPLWAGSLSLGLSNASVNILRGFARQDGSGRWTAEFLLSPNAGAPDLGALDFLGLAFGSQARDDGGPVVLSHYALDGGPDQGAALYLEVRGPDRLGFLGSLLRSLARLGLSPRQMYITTREDEAFDRFLLKTVSGGVPGDDVRRALEARLDESLAAGRHRTVEMAVPF